MQSLKSELSKKAQAGLVPLGTYLAARHLKGPIVHRFSHPELSEEEARNFIHKKLKDENLKDWTIAFREKVPHKDRLAKSYIPRPIRNSIPKEKISQMVQESWENRDWTYPNPKIIHVNTLTKPAILHEIGHAKDYDRNPDSAMTKAIFLPEVVAGASTTFASILALTKKFKGSKLSKYYAPIILAGSLPLAIRELKASHYAVKTSKEGKQTLKELMPLSLGYTALPVIPISMIYFMRKILKR